MQIIGHQKQLNILNKSIERKRLAHAYLFLGPENVGKFTVALDLAEKLTGQSNQKINADLIIIRPGEDKNDGPEDKKPVKSGKTVSQKKEIKVEQIRELQRQFSFFSEDGKYKVAIIDEAEKLNKQAQNALLKTLEEPNDFSIIILVAKDDKKLLPTIISRCQKIKFGPLTETEIEDWAREKNIFFGKETEKDEIIFWSLGRPGLILQLIGDKNELEERRKIQVQLENMPSQNLTEKFSLAEEMSKEKETSRKALGFWIILLRQSLLKKNNLKISAAKALEIIKEIERSLEIMRDTNSNTRLVLENLFLKV